MATDLDDMKVVQDAVMAELGLPKASARKFSKMTAALFEETAPKFSVVPHPGCTAILDDQVGRTVQLRGFIVKESEGAYRPKIEVWDQAEVQLGELEGDKTQLMIVAIHIEECIAFIEGIDPLEVRIDRIPGATDITASDLRYEIWFLYQALNWHRSSLRFKLSKTYLRKFPERNGAFGLEVDSSALQKAQLAQEKAKAPQSAFAPYNNLELNELVKAIEDAYEGKVRPRTVKDLESECPVYKESKSKFARFAKDQGVSTSDFLKHQGLLSEVAIPGSRPRPSRAMVDAWNSEMGFASGESLSECYPDKSIAVFRAVVIGKSVSMPYPSESLIFEALRRGDILACESAPNESDAEYGASPLVCALNGNLRFRFAGDFGSFAVLSYEFLPSLIERVRYYDYGAKDLLLLVAKNDECGVAADGIVAKVVGFVGGKSNCGVVIEVSVAFEEEVYRQYRASLDYRFDNQPLPKFVSATVDESGMGTAKFEDSISPYEDGLYTSNRCVLASVASAKLAVEEAHGTFEKFKKVINKNVQVDGLSVPIVFKPSRSFTQLQKYIDQGEMIAPNENLQEDDWAEWNKGSMLAVDDMPPYGVSRDLLVTPEESVSCFIDMMRVLALLTDDEMLSRVVAKAPRRKDGGLADNRLAISVDMDGIFKDGTYYCVNAKSGSKSGGLSHPSGSIEITMDRKKQPWQEKHAGGAARFLEEHADIVERMGI